MDEDLTDILTASASLSSSSRADRAEGTSSGIRKPSKSASGGGGSTWKGLGVTPALVKGLNLRGFSTPTPIQRTTLPYLLSTPPRDVVGMARTGSGKTLAYLIPLLQSLRTHSPTFGARAMIIVPNRELAQQVLKVGKDLARAVKRDAEGSEPLRWCLVIGGERLEDQFEGLTGNPDVIIGTPGRLLHLFIEMSYSLQTLTHVIFDEADRLFELNFSTQLYEILTRLPPSTLRQTLLFSATLPKTLVEFAKAGLENPKLVRLDAETKISEDLRMSFWSVREEEKEGALLVLLREVVGVQPAGEDAGIYVVSSDDEEEEKSKGKGKFKGKRNGKKRTFKKAEKQVIIFCSTKHHVEYLAGLLTHSHAGYSVSTIYSSLDQVARRGHLAAFVSGRTQLLLVTDVAARGIDVPALEFVINYDIPPSPRSFIHRVGRTARNGRSGWAHTLVCGKGEIGYLYDLELFLGRGILTSFPVKEEVDFQGHLVLGTVGRERIDEEVERVKSLVGDKLGSLARLRDVAGRGRKAFEKGRPKPSSASLRRAKELDLTALRVNPLLFVGGEGGREAKGEKAMRGKEELLEKIMNFRNKETVFEFGKKGERSEAGILMKKRRKELEGKVKKAEKRKREVLEAAGEEDGDEAERSEGEEAGELELEMADDEDLKDAFDIEDDLPKKRKKKNDDYKEDNFYLGYTQPGADTEKGYSMRDTSTFASAAQAATFDLSGGKAGDEIAERPQKASIIRWDRRQKANEKKGALDQGKKMIISESGRKIPASFKSGMFEEWKGRKKVKVPKAGERELEGVKVQTKKRWNHNKVTEKKGLGNSSAKRVGKEELKSVAKIRKERMEKAKRKERSNQPRRKKK